MDKEPLDLIDWCCLAASAVYPPLMIFAVGQWVIRRSPGARNMMLHVGERFIPQFSLPRSDQPEPARITRQATIWQAIMHLPHILIVGHTDGGKSIFIRAITANLLHDKAEVLVLDSNSAQRHYPSGITLHNDSNKWEAIMKNIMATFNNRLQSWRDAPQDIDFTALWIVSDESHELMSIPACRESIETLIRQGRKVNMHIILASQDSQVKTLNIEGASSLLQNLTRCEVQKRSDGTRYATIQGIAYNIPTLPKTYPSRPVQTSPDQQDQRLLATLLATSLPQSKAVDQRDPQRPARPAETSEQTTPDPAAIRAKLVELGSKNKVAAWLHEEYGIASKGKAYEIIKQAE